MKALIELIDNLKVKDLVLRIEKDKKSLILAALVFLAVTYLDYSFIMKPQFAGNKDTTVKIVKLKKDMDVLNNDLLKMQQSKNQKTDSKSARYTGPRKIIQDAEVPAFLDNISTMANRNGIQILQVKVVRDVGAKAEKNFTLFKAAPLFITLDTICDYHRLGKFLNDLENQEAYCGVQDLRITVYSQNYLNQRAGLILKSYVKK